MSKNAYELSDAFGFLFTGEVELLMRYAAFVCRPSRVPVIANIGAGVGTSALAFREGCSKAQIYTIDISTGGPLGGLENEQTAFRNAGKELPIEILSDSVLAGKEWKTKCPDCDIVFIDGDHTKNNVIADIEAWRPNVLQGGFMLFHDYDGKFWPDVKGVVDEYMADWDFMEVAVTTIAFRKKIDDRK